MAISRFKIVFYKQSFKTPVEVEYFKYRVYELKASQRSIAVGISADKDSNISQSRNWHCFYTRFVLI